MAFKTACSKRDTSLKSSSWHHRLACPAIICWTRETSGSISSRSFGKLKLKIGDRSVVDQTTVVGISACQLQDVFDRVDKHLVELRLGDITGGATLEGLRGKRFAAMTGHQDDGDFRKLDTNRFDQFQPIHLWHLHVS